MPDSITIFGNLYFSEMTPDQYLNSIVANKKAPTISLSDYRLANINSILTKWAGQQLAELKASGSNTKGTAVKGIADFDIFISLKSDTEESLKEIFTKLDAYVSQNGITTRKQNFSIGIMQNGLSIDLVPAKKQSGYQNYHSIYSSKRDTWMQTNVDLHKITVVNSGRQSEIILGKIWRQLNNLDFPSVYLELTVLDALKNKSIGAVGNNFLSVLTYLRDYFVDSSVTDPSNTNNVVSDTLYKYEKEKIAECAEKSLKQQYWEKIIW